jgi:hypothetical protein
MRPAKVPQHLDVPDQLVWGLSATDLLALGAGGAAALWFYHLCPGPAAVRVASTLPALAATALLTWLELAGVHLRVWVFLALAYLSRPRRHTFVGAR